MKLWLRILVFAAALAIGTPAVAAESDTIVKLDEALKAVVTFEHGDNSGPLVFVEQVVMDAAKDARLREAVEQRLVQALGTTSSRDAKSFLCRQLRTIGTARCVRQLEKLLTDPESSHMARYALGSIEDPAADAALHRALSKTSGKLQVGILNTLANRRYRRASPDIARLLGSSDAQVAEAAARALGRMGGAEAVKALEAARPKASGTLRLRIDNALLMCAEQLLAEGERLEAVRIYNMFYMPRQEKTHLRLAGLRGLVAAWGPEGVQLLIDSIKDSDPDLSRGTISLMTTTPGPDATKALASLLPSLSPQAQELALRALGDRGEPGAANAISAATKSPNEAVRIAAVEALGKVGDASAVSVLARAAAAADGQEKQVARASLERLGGDDVNATLIRSINSGEPEVRAEIIRAIAARRVMHTAGELLKAARDDNENVRREAIRALGALVDVSELDILLELAMEPKDAKDLAAFEQAIAAVFRRIRSRDRQAAPVLAALGEASVEVKPMLVRLLGRPATPQALQAVRDALKDRNDQVKDAAVRTLSEWPDAAPAEDLLVLARTSTAQAHKVLALRGYVRMAGMSKDPTAMYVRAMELAERPDDKKLVLGGLGGATSLQALALVEQYLEDSQLQSEAGQAAVRIADRLRQSDAARAKAALKKVVAVVKDTRIRRQAQDVINDMEKYDGYILVWLGAGPYTAKGEDGRAVFDKTYPPETPEASDADWKAITRGVGSWDINLEATFGSRDYCAAYLRTRIWSPERQKVRLELGSDDAVKAWLNGKIIHEKFGSRGLSPMQDLVNAELKEGWNELLLKVVDNEGGWSFCCRVRKPDGSALEGLRFEAK